MTHQEIFEFFESCDTDELVRVKIRFEDKMLKQTWIISNVRLEENIGLFVHYIPFSRTELQVAFIPLNKTVEYGIVDAEYA